MGSFILHFADIQSGSTKCAYQVVLMAGRRPNLVEMGVRSGRLSTTGILLDLSPAPPGFPREIRSHWISERLGETPYRKPKATMFFTPLMSRNASMLTGSQAHRDHAVPEEKRGPVQRLCDSVPESQTSCWDEQGRDDQKVESSLRLEDSRVLLAAPVGVAVYEPAAEPSSDEITNQAGNSTAGYTISGKGRMKSFSRLSSFGTPDQRLSSCSIIASLESSRPALRPRHHSANVTATVHRCSCQSVSPAESESSRIVSRERRIRLSVSKRRSKERARTYHLQDNPVTTKPQIRGPRVKYKSLTIEAPKASVDDPAKAPMILLQSRDSKDCATAPQSARSGPRRRRRRRVTGRRWRSWS
ncbi:hypothetical protein KC333_g61 [Hortaea werneckii]|nr:hypothetical protein KC333_g61 [Hortaea werneckii]